MIDNTKRKKKSNFVTLEIWLLKCLNLSECSFAITKKDQITTRKKE